MRRTKNNHDYNFDHPFMDEHEELQCENDRQHEYARIMEPHKNKDAHYEYPYLYPH